MKLLESLKYLSIKMVKTKHTLPSSGGGEKGAKWPTVILNNYFSATECPIDLKPSYISKFVECREVCKKVDQFGP